MQISYVTTYDSLDVHNWSGLGHYIAKSLENQNVHIDYVGNLNAKPNLSLDIKSKLYKILGQNFEFEREPYMVKQFANQAKQLIDLNTDIIFSPGTLPIAFLETVKPKVFYTDATFAGMINFYPEFSNFSTETIKHGNYIEQAALDSSTIAIYSSEWAAKTAIDHYNIDRNKIKVVPFGANIEHDYELKDIQNIVCSRSSLECNILFSGRDWKRKGGNFAIEVVGKLNEQGLNTKLHLVGLDKIPRGGILPDYVINHGFISKSTQEGKNKINDLIRQSHFLILPTIADASPLALCEANSFGTPCITTNVGGISTIIKDDINGKTFSLNDDAEDYANYIHSTFSKTNDYRNLAYGSFNEFETRLNWRVAGTRLKQILQEIR